MKRLAIALVVLATLACPNTPHPGSADPNAFTVAAYGDSLTSGYMGAPSWVASLPGTWTVFNGGIAGERGTPNRNASGDYLVTGTMRPVSSPDVEKLDNTNGTGWKVLVMFWGTNDVAYPWFRDPGAPPTGAPAYAEIDDEDLMGALEIMAAVLAAKGIDVVVVWPPPLQGQDLPNERLARMLPTIQARIESHGMPFVDLYTAFSVPAVPDPSIYFAADGVHWSAAGAARAAGLIEDAIRGVRPDAP